MTQVKSPDEKRTADAQLSSSPFFLVGSERSGTTLLRLMLDHHPQLRCGHESDFIVDDLDRYQATPPERLRQVWESKRAYITYRQRGLPEPPAVNSYQELVDWLLTVLREQHQKEITGVTVHWAADKLPQIAPDARYIHLLRDGRAVANSVVQMGWAGNTYHGALYWKRAMDGITRLKQQVNGDRWLEVRYEDLLTSVEPTLERICSFLNVTYSPAMLSYSENSTYECIDASNAHRWRLRIQPKDILYAEIAAADELERWGYRLIFPRFRIGVIERVLLHVEDRWGRWCFNVNRYGLYIVVARKLRRVLRLGQGQIERRCAAIAKEHRR